MKQVMANEGAEASDRVATILVAHIHILSVDSVWDHPANLNFALPLFSVS